MTFFSIQTKLLKVNRKPYFSIRFACEQLRQCLCDGIPTIHALLVCDTTSRVLSIRKGGVLTKFKKDERFQQDIFLFLEKDI